MRGIVKSPDETPVAFERSGAGPPLIIVDGVMACRRSDRAASSRRSSLAASPATATTGALGSDRRCLDLLDSARDRRHPSDGPASGGAGVPTRTLIRRRARARRRKPRLGRHQGAAPRLRSAFRAGGRHRRANERSSRRDRRGRSSHACELLGRCSQFSRVAHAAVSDTVPVTDARVLARPTRCSRRGSLSR